MDSRASRQERWKIDMIRNTDGQFEGLEMVGERPKKRRRRQGAGVCLFEVVRWLKNVENRRQTEEEGVWRNPNRLSYVYVDHNQTTLACNVRWWMNSPREENIPFDIIISVDDDVLRG
jgi:hypothetical protein